MRLSSVTCASFFLAALVLWSSHAAAGILLFPFRTYRHLGVKYTLAHMHVDPAGTDRGYPALQSFAGFLRGQATDAYFDNLMVSYPHIDRSVFDNMKTELVNHKGRMEIFVGFVGENLDKVAFTFAMVPDHEGVLPGEVSFAESRASWPLFWQQWDMLQRTALNTRPSRPLARQRESAKPTSATISKA